MLVKGQEQGKDAVRYLEEGLERLEPTVYCNDGRGDVPATRPD